MDFRVGDICVTVDPPDRNHWLEDCVNQKVEILFINFDGEVEIRWTSPPRLEKQSSTFTRFEYLRLCETSRVKRILENYENR